MRQKGEVHISQLAPGQHEYGGGMSHNLNELGEDGKMFRCALIGCQRTWKVGPIVIVPRTEAKGHFYSECKRLAIPLLDVRHRGGT
jgi:hypothetical protein